MADSLKIIVSELLEIAPDQLAAERALSGARLQGSLGRSILDAAMRRRLGIQSAACYTAKTYGELEAAVNGTSLPPAFNGSNGEATAKPKLSTETPSLAGFVGAACGVDIELIANLPQTSDFWTHEFYTTHFTAAEIAYCLTQQIPAEHFAARWCAKEAIKKCEPALLNEQMRNLEVVSRSGAAPALRRHANGHAIDLPHALSLSHTGDSAIAVVMRVNQSAPATPPLVPANSAIEVPTQSTNPLFLLAMGIGCLAAVLSAAALIVAIRH
jgi:holo-[acyl-carrier protein] synthase